MDRVAFSVGPTVVGIAPISSESNVLWQVPYCRQAAFCKIPSYVKQHFHCILQHVTFSFSLSLSCIPSDDAIMFFTLIEINLLFSPWFFVDNDVGLLGRQYNDLVYNCQPLFGICRLLVSRRDPCGHRHFDAISEQVHRYRRIFFSLSNINHYSAIFVS